VRSNRAGRTNPLILKASSEVFLFWYNYDVTQDEVIQFINDHHFMVISTQTEDYPESANVEFGNDGLTLIFDTGDTSRKFKNIQKSPKVSVVIGWDEHVNKTVQYQGIAEVLTGEELRRLKKVYFTKSPEAQKWENTKGNVYLKVSPKWVRMTDLNTNPWTISVFEF
jgi:general stress protein 26